MLLRGLLVVASALMVTGCSSYYVPQSQGRVSVIMQGGQMAYVRDGRVYPHGVFGHGLVQAVRGNPDAERVARKYHRRNKNGFLIAMAGAACAVVASALMARRLDDDPEEVPQELWLAMGCMAGVMPGGILYTVSGQPYRFDAINIFNDGAAGTYAPPPPAWGLPPGQSPSAPPYRSR